MILGLDGEALVLRVERRPLGDGPGLEDAVKLEPEVIVQAGRRVLWMTKRGYSARAILALPLGSAVFVKSRFCW
jgi:hypothetical protein